MKGKLILQHRLHIFKWICGCICFIIIIINNNTALVWSNNNHPTQPHTTLQVHTDLKLAYTSWDLAWDLIVPYAHIQIDKCRSWRGNERTHSILAYVHLINEGQWVYLKCNEIENYTNTQTQFFSPIVMTVIWNKTNVHKLYHADIL